MRRGLLATSEELSCLGDLVGRVPFDRMYRALQRRCSLILDSEPIQEAAWRSAREGHPSGVATRLAGDVQGRLFDLIVRHRIDPSRPCRDRAVRELKALLSLPEWADPSHDGPDAHLLRGEACATAAIALDWLAEELSPADRVRCVRAIREKGLRPYLRAVKAGAFRQPCRHNWGAVIHGGVGIAALLLEDDEDVAGEALGAARSAMESFFGALGREGGWNEGLGRWAYAMRYVLLFGEALARITKDSSVFRHRGMDVTGLFPIYFTPHGVPVGFGDCPPAPTCGVFYLLARRFGRPELIWWLDRYAFGREVSPTGCCDAGLGILFRPGDCPPDPPPSLQLVKAYNEIGWVAMADRWPSPNLYAALKAGDLSADRARLDMNSLQLAIGGEVLLQDVGPSDAAAGQYLSAGAQTPAPNPSWARNTVTMGAREHRLDAVGNIVESQVAADYRWAAGDAGTALGEGTRFVRHVVMTCSGDSDGDRMVVVLDDVASPVCEPIRLAWHTPGEAVLGKDGKSGAVAGRSARLHFALASTCSSAVVAASGQTGRRGRSVVVETAPTNRAVLVSAFSVQPVGKIRLKRSQRGDVTLDAGTRRLCFQARRRGLQLLRVDRAR